MAAAVHDASEPAPRSQASAAALAIATAQGGVAAALFACARTMLPAGLDPPWFAAQLPFPGVLGTIVLVACLLLVPPLALALLAIVVQRWRAHAPPLRTVPVFLALAVLGPFVSIVPGAVATAIASVLATVEVVVRGAHGHRNTLLWMLALWCCTLAVSVALLWGFAALASV